MIHFTTPSDAAAQTGQSLKTVMQDWPAEYPGLFVQGACVMLLERDALQEVVVGQDPSVKLVLAYEAFLTSTTDEEGECRSDFFNRYLSQLEPELFDGDEIRINVRVRSSSVRQVIDAWNGGAR